MIRRKTPKATPSHPPSHPRSRFASWLGTAALMVCVVLAAQWWGGRGLAHGEAPLLTGRGLDGREIDLARYRGEPVLVHFWATWCPLCKIGNGTIDAIAERHRVVTVAMQSGSADELRRFLAAQGLSFPVVSDASGDLAAQWGVSAVPTSFVIDARGRIRFATRGLSSGTGLRVRLWSASMLD